MTDTQAVSPEAQAAQATLEQRIDTAVEQAAQVASAFSPAIGAAIQAGVAIEPVISGFIHLLAALFKHHVSTPAPAPSTPSPTPQPQG